jgi:hypothetical protein
VLFSSVDPFRVRFFVSRSTTAERRSSPMFAVPPNTLVRPGHLGIAHPVRIANEHAAARKTWAHLVRYDPEQRWCGLLQRTVDYEAWLLTWLPGQHTELHDHGGATGAFTVVSGTLSEHVRRTGAGDPAHALNSISSGQARVFGPHYVHRVANTGSDPAISIHVYRPARVRMRLYTDESEDL